MLVMVSCNANRDDAVGVHVQAMAAAAAADARFRMELESRLSQLESKITYVASSALSSVAQGSQSGGLTGMGVDAGVTAASIAGVHPQCLPP